MIVSPLSLKDSSIRLALIHSPGISESNAALRAWCDRIAARDGASVAWMSLGSPDNYPQTFLGHLDQALAAVSASDPEPAERMSLANGCAPDPWPDGISVQNWLEDGLTECLNRLADFPGELLLVLNGYQAINSAAIHQAVGMMLEYLPPQVHLVIASQSEPPLPLARLRARRQLLEIRSLEVCPGS